MRTLVLASAVLLLSPVAAPAQPGAAEITGRVFDQHGAVLPGVSIVLTNEQTGVFRATTSGPDGTYLAQQLAPGHYRLVATLEGFRTTERGNVLLQLGTTVALNITLEVGSRQEIVTVTSATPLLDRTAQVGGHIGAADLTGLPTTNRSSFAALGLLPGIQFVATNQMGNDTIVANGQAGQTNNISVDGAYNTDDSTGTTFGGQVRTPLEAIQEIQLVTSQYGAEHGRAGGAIVNVITKPGTNSFSGVAFAYAASHRLTARDYFVKQANLPEPRTARREWGFVLGGPVVRNKAHFFVSLERQVDQPSRTGTFATRPSLDFSIVEDRTTLNGLVRFDHQISAQHTWAVRWLREDAPQHPIVGPRTTQGTFGDETDRDQIAVASLASVFGHSRFNTFRVARTWEHVWRGNECFRAQGGNGKWTGFDFGDEDEGDQARCPPVLDHLSFVAQASGQAVGSWGSNYQLEDHFSWFVPGNKGAHEFKVGLRFTYAALQQISQVNRNGTFRFSTDLPFDPSNPRTYPERLSIRIPEAYEATLMSRTLEMYAQDTWQIGARTTLSAGLRYDLEVIPINETDNPLFGDGRQYPVDTNNLAPRIAVTRQVGASETSLVRAGYGIFYSRTLLGTLEDVVEFPKFTSAINALFPNDTVDPGPSRGQFPTDPLLVNGPVINQELLYQRFPPGTRLRNTGVVVFDSPDRRQPLAHQFTAGYVRQLSASLAIHADYVRIANKHLFLSRNLNPMMRADTTRTGVITRVDAFGVLGEPYSQQVWVLENGGETVYDGMEFQLEKRHGEGWSARLAYSLSYSRGTAGNQEVRNTDQFLTDLRLDRRWGPRPTDRRHILSVSGRANVPRSGGAIIATTVRYMSGAPFTLIDTGIDADRNGELNDPLPPGTYSGTAPNALTNVEYRGGRNGAYGPDYFEIDLRFGWRRAIARGTLDLFVDTYNITNRTNFENPSTDRRLAATFLVPTQLRGGTGSRQAQLGVRYAF